MEQIYDALFNKGKISVALGLAPSMMLFGIPCGQCQHMRFLRTFCFNCGHVFNFKEEVMKRLLYEDQLGVGNETVNRRGSLVQLIKSHPVSVSTADDDSDGLNCNSFDVAALQALNTLYSFVKKKSVNEKYGGDLLFLIRNLMLHSGGIHKRFAQKILNKELLQWLETRGHEELQTVGVLDRLEGCHVAVQVLSLNSRMQEAFLEARRHTPEDPKQLLVARMLERTPVEPPKGLEGAKLGGKRPYRRRKHSDEPYKRKKKRPVKGGQDITADCKVQSSSNGDVNGTIKHEGGHGEMKKVVRASSAEEEGQDEEESSIILIDLTVDSDEVSEESVHISPVHQNATIRSIAESLLRVSSHTQNADPPGPSQDNMSESSGAESETVSPRTSSSSTNHSAGSMAEQGSRVMKRGKRCSPQKTNRTARPRYAKFSAYERAVEQEMLQLDESVFGDLDVEDRVLLTEIQLQFIRCRARIREVLPQIDRFELLHHFDMGTTTLPITCAHNCGVCGNHQKNEKNPDGTFSCYVCSPKHPNVIRTNIDYSAMTSGLCWTYMCADLNIELNSNHPGEPTTVDGLCNAVRLLSLVRSYQDIDGIGKNYFEHQCYFVTHLIYCFSDWGQHSLSRSLFSEEFFFIVKNIRLIIYIEHVELVGEFVQCLRILQYSPVNDPELVPLVEEAQYFLLHKEMKPAQSKAQDKQDRQVFKNPEKILEKVREFRDTNKRETYSKYHTLYCEIVGLVEPAYTMDENERRNPPSPNILKYL